MIFMLRRVARLLPLLALLAFCASCGNFFLSNSSILTVTVTPTAVILAAAPDATTPGDKYTLESSATTVGGTATNDTSTATWTSSAPSVVTAGSGGALTAVGTTGGSTATITATDGGQTGTATVLLYTGAAPSSLSVSPQNTSLIPSSITPGTAIQLLAFASINGQPNFNITNDVTWTSSDSTVATVNASGLVSVLSTATAGTTFTVTATANFGPSATTSTVTGTSTTFTILGSTVF